MRFKAQSFSNICLLFLVKSPTCPEGESMTGHREGYCSVLFLPASPLSQYFILEGLSELTRQHHSSNPQLYIANGAASCRARPAGLRTPLKTNNTHFDGVFVEMSLIPELFLPGWRIWGWWSRSYRVSFWRFRRRFPRHRWTQVWRLCWRWSQEPCSRWRSCGTSSCHGLSWNYKQR